MCASGNGAPFLRESLPLPQQEQKKELIMTDTGTAKPRRSEGGFAAGDDDDADVLCTGPACPVPEFSTSSRCVTLLNPCKHSRDSKRPLLVYVPGMDCTGQGISKQLPYLIASGYDIRCVYIPSNDRSSWAKLVRRLIPLLRKEQVLDGKVRQVTLLGESFGGPLALRLAKAAPDIISRLVLVNPATNFQKSNPFASFCSSTGLLALFPEALYKTAQDVLMPLMVNRDRVKLSDRRDIFSPVDLVPAACAAWRFSLLNDSTGLDNADISSIKIPTLLLSSAEDHVLSSVEEGGRLQRLLPNSKRIILPNSGHTVLLEDSMNLSDIMEMHGFRSSKSAQVSVPLSPNWKAPTLGHMEKNATRDETLDEMGRLLQPWRILTSPLVSGEENLPNPELERPILFVGNHTMFGVYDTPLLFHELFLRGFRCRGLAHPGHWRTVVGQLFERYGHVKATKLAAYRLLKEKEHVLLFPGGAREVCKRKGEEYKLLWKPTADFVRMASRFNAIIVPFGTLGGDDAYKIIFDGNDMLKSPLAPLVRDVYKYLNISLDTIYPVTAFPGTNLPSLFAIPHIERIYFHFAEPVDTALFKGSMEDRDKYNQMYSLVKERVERSIDLLRNIRSKDKERDLPKRLLGKVLDQLPEFKGMQT